MFELEPTIREARQRFGELHIYVDTPVLVDLVGARRRASEAVFAQAIERPWTIWSSLFASMEAYDAQQEATYLTSRIRRGLSGEQVWRNRRERDLAPQVLGKIARRVGRAIDRVAPSIKWVVLDDEGWDLATDLAASTNITAADCLHLAAALITDCDVLLSSDKFFCREAQESLAVASPEDMMAVISRLGV